jgi:hypothetical protein
MDGDMSQMMCLLLVSFGCEKDCERWSPRTLWLGSFIMLEVSDVAVSVTDHDGFVP